MINNSLKPHRARHLRNPIVQEYVLPDVSANRHGYVRSKEENLAPTSANLPVLVMENERFTIPELLFNPSYVGKFA